MKRKTNPNARSQTRGLIYEPKLDWDKVNYIRANFKEYDPVYGCKGMGKKFGVSANTVSKIVNNKIWKARPCSDDALPPFTNKHFWKMEAERHREYLAFKAEITAIRAMLDERDECGPLF